MNELAKTYDEMLDEAELEMYKIGTSDFESLGFFCGGMFIKPIVVPRGGYLTSKVHKVEHPFFLMSGEIELFICDDSGEIRSVILRAPHIDITTSGTRRFAKAHTDVLWVTVHRTDKHTEEEVEGEVIQERENRLLTEFLTSINIIQ